MVWRCGRLSIKALRSQACRRKRAGVYLGSSGRPSRLRTWNVGNRQGCVAAPRSSPPRLRQQPPHLAAGQEDCE
eukprot:scaffold132746_cov31-Tisochrysis_lutea.AAC.5